MRLVMGNVAMLSVLLLYSYQSLSISRLSKTWIDCASVEFGKRPCFSCPVDVFNLVLELYFYFYPDINSKNGLFY